MLLANIGAAARRASMVAHRLIFFLVVVNVYGHVLCLSGVVNDFVLIELHGIRFF
jgi:hypothetical protein